MTELKFNEKCWIIKGYRNCKWACGFFIYESTGGPGSVDFNWEKVFKHRNTIIGFKHTHPNGFLNPSTIDNRTMAGWVKGLNKSLLCGIQSGKKQNFFIYERNGCEVIHRKIPFLIIGNYILAKIG